MKINPFKLEVVLIFSLISLVSFLFLPVFSLADINTGIPCQSDEECELYNGYYCNFGENFCYSPEEEAAETEAAAESEEDEIESSVSALENKLSQLQQEVNSLKDSLSNEQSKVNQLSRNLASLQEKAEQAASGTQTVSTGLAGLQEEVGTTQTKVEEIGEELEEEKSFTQLLKLIFFLVILGIAAVVLVYFFGRKKEKVHPEVRSFITEHIQAGKKYPHIKEALQGAGWKEPEILHAYKGTMRHNYQQYRKSGTAGKPLSTSARQAPSDKNKIISLAIVSILLIFGIFFLLSGTVGKAFFMERWVNVSSGEVVDVARCTPPQILTPDGDACCTDANGNSLCDNLERVIEEVKEGCVDNLQCSGNQLCINNQCLALAELYEGSPFCDKLCDFYSVNVRANDETYNYRPGLGSYTCAGALEWKTMKGMPRHCEGEPAVVPFKIIKKDAGKILSEEIVALRERESKKVNHPNLDCSLTLTLEKVYELCE